jgi:Holliday junction resolvase
MVYARKTDCNHRQIVSALRKIGCKVMDLSRVGHGCPDLIAMLGYRLRFLECKRPGGKLTEDQKKWHADWHNHVCVVETPEEAIRVMTL